MSAIAKRAQRAINESTTTRTGAGRPPKGQHAGIIVCARIDPALVVELDAITGLSPGELLRMAIFAARRAKKGATDADLARTVRAWLRPAAIDKARSPLP